jgi:hypothetical protein
MVGGMVVYEAFFPVGRVFLKGVCCMDWSMHGGDLYCCLHCIGM